MKTRGRLLLTGAHGMAGRNILAHPAAQAWQILAPTRPDLDLTDYAATQRYLEAQAPDVVVHAAGRVGGIQANMAAPVDFLVTNLDLGRNVILAASKVGVPRLLNLGSSCMYPRDARNPLTEDMVLKGELEPTNEGYALAKIVAARLCQYLRRENPACLYKTMIPCNLYGPHDKFAPEHSHLIPAVLHKLHLAKTRGEGTVAIWGDGTARREFMYAGDFADAVWQAVERLDAMPDDMNVGLGHDHTIDEYYQAAAEVVGWSGRFVHELDRPVGMQRKLVAIDRQTQWGWSAKTSLRDGLRKTYDYYLEEVAK